MSYYDLPQEEQNRLRDAGVDYDLQACLEYNSQSFSVTDIAKVVAVWEGERDGDDYRWVIKLTPEAKKTHGKGFVFLQGGCDYTGWDCQSWATSEFETSALKAAKRALGNVELKDSTPMNAGMGHMLNILSGSYSDNFQTVYDELVKQIKSSKTKTWHEQKDEELNTKDLKKI